MYQVFPVVAAFRPRLWQWWWASCRGGALTGALMFVIAWQSQDAALTIDSGWLLGPMLVGVFQSAVLLPALGRRWPWILSCLLGAALWVMFTLGMSWLTGQPRTIASTAAQQLVSGMLSMLILGGCQALVLRRAFRKTGWWLGAMVAGSLAGQAISLGLGQLSEAAIGSVAEGVFVWGMMMALAWGVMMLIPGLALVYHLAPTAAGVAPPADQPALE